MSPLVRETLHAIERSGALHKAYLAHLALLGLVVVVWWPKRELVLMLDDASEPRTLAAAIAALGALLAYHTLRSGGGEIALRERDPLREWAQSTPVGAARIAGGCIAAQLIESAYLVVLALPLVLIAFAVAGSTWPELTWGLTTAVVQALFYALLGACVELGLGQNDVVAFTTRRGALLVGYLATPFLFPPASHLMVAIGLARTTADPALSDHIAFFVIYTGLCGLLAVTLYVLLRQQKRAVKDEPLTGGARHGVDAQR